MGLCALLSVVIAQWWLGGATHWVALGLRAVVALILGTVLGKILGLQVARWDLRRIAQRIQASMGLTDAGDL